MEKLFPRITSILLAVLLLLCSCGSGHRNEQLSERPLAAGTKRQTVTLTDEQTAAGSAQLHDFTASLLKESFANENLLLSPLNVMNSLILAMNGASGDTLSEMEAVLGDTALMSDYLANVSASFTQSEDVKISNASSVWLRDTGMTEFSKDYLKKMERFFGSEIYKAPFNENTVLDINRWASNKTYGMINAVIQEIPAFTQLYLISATAFDAKWDDPYKPEQVKKEPFYPENAAETEAFLMYSTEHTFLSNEQAIGFMREYKGGRYAFAALLPNEGVSMTDFVGSLDGEQLETLLWNTGYETIHAALPKFTLRYKQDLIPAMKQLGIDDLFIPDVCDLSGIGVCEVPPQLYVDIIWHDTFIEVDEEGTRAAAVTTTGVTGSSAKPKEPIRIILDRPFVYLLVDTVQQVPIFIGIMMTP